MEITAKLGYRNLLNFLNALSTLSVIPEHIDFYKTYAEIVIRKRLCFCVDYKEIVVSQGIIDWRLFYSDESKEFSYEDILAELKQTNVLNQERIEETK